jgi:hypothetical protein
MALGVFVVSTFPLLASGIFAGVGLTVSDEIVPRGAIAQIKVSVTEPKPISTGRGRYSTGAFASIDGIALMSARGDAAGVAIVDGGGLSLTVVSPSGSYGLDADYPVLTIAGHVSAQAPAGAVFPVDIDGGSLNFTDPSGAAYATETKSGSITIGAHVSIGDVTPGSADLPAGAVVSILGTGFVPKTDVRFKEGRIASVRYISASRLDVVLARPARMHGMEVHVQNPDKTEATYYSYQRTTRDGASVHPVLQHAVPVFSRGSMLSATVDLAGVSSGIAVQNIERVPAAVTADLVDADGHVVASIDLTLGPSRYIARDVYELFQLDYTSSMSVRISASSAVQVMGIAVDADGGATPIAPR